MAWGQHLSHFKQLIVTLWKNKIQAQRLLLLSAYIENVIKITNKNQKENQLNSNVREEKKQKKKKRKTEVTRGKK